MSNEMNLRTSIAVALLWVVGSAGQAFAQTQGPAPLPPPADGAAPRTDSATPPLEPGQPAAPVPGQAAAPSPMYQGRSLSAQAKEEFDNQPEKPEGYDLSRFRERPRREGFTLELGTGLALTHLGGSGTSDTFVGIAPFSLSLGGFVSNQVAIMFRMAGSSWFADDTFGDRTMFTSAFYGPAVQWWVAREIFVAAGVGVGVLSEGFFDSDNNDTGMMFTARFGYSFYTSTDHSVAVVAELMPAFYSDVTSLGTTVQLQWQLL